MTALDPRLELAELTPGAEGERVAAQLDAHRIVIRAPADRCVALADQAALLHLVNLATRLFAHVEVDVDGSAPWRSPLLAGGTLGERFAGLATVRPAAAAQARTDLVLWWGRDDAGGIAGDADGWTYAIGRTLPRRDDGAAPPLGAVAAADLMVAQAFGRALAPLGMPFHPVELLVANLVDLRNAPAPESAPVAHARLGRTLLPGAGSVGSSLIYVALLTGVPGGPVVAIDPDRFSARNRLRYPILMAPTDARKVEWLHDLAVSSPLDVEPFVGDVQQWLEAQPELPVEPLVLVSVDTAEGRRDATDVLARRTVNCGVAGVALHVAGHRFGDEGCAYCQYVDAQPALSAAAMLGQALGLPANRVAAIHQAGGRLEQRDVEAVVAAGVLRGAPPCEGDRLDDLHRRLYAQAGVPVAGGGQVLVSAPQVSAMAGLLLLAEGIKASTPSLNRYAISGRYDIDLSGAPPGFTMANRRDMSRRCLCWSGVRRRAYLQMHGEPT